MPFRKQEPRNERESLSAEDLEILENICAGLDLGPDPAGDDYRRIIDFALRRMQADLNSGSNREVIEEVRREILFRQWCAEKMGEGQMETRSFSALPSVPPSI